MDLFSDVLLRLSLDVTGFTKKLSAVFQSPSSVVKRVTIVLPAGELTASAEHGLGRGYEDAGLMGQSGPGAVYALAPDGTTSATLVTVGIDVAAASDITVTLWVR